MRIGLILLALVALFVPVPPEWVERAYSQSFYLWLQPSLTFLSNLAPIALLDVAISAALVVFAWTLVRDWRAGGPRRAASASLLRLGAVAAGIYVLFLFTWGLNYRRLPLEAKLAFDRERITADAARTLAAVAIARVNELHPRAHATELRPEALASSLGETQRLLASRRAAAVGRPKRSLAGLYFRYAAIDGMTVPIFLEVILNPDLLAVERPAVLAHEWAHLAGYADESEANFISWITCVRSVDPVAQYSGWLEAYAHAAGSLPRETRALLAPLDEGPRQDLRAIAARYARSSPRVRGAARGVYDSYLKANRIEEGIASYGAVLQLMLGTTYDPDWTPKLSNSR